jgi:hypothetical protein
MKRLTIAALVALGTLVPAAPVYAQQQSNMEKVCYGTIPQETMHEVVRKAIAKVTAPGNSYRSDSVGLDIYMMVLNDVGTLMGPKVDSYGRNVKNPLSPPAFTMTNDLKLGTRAIISCFPEVQEAVAKQQAEIAESRSQ